MAAYDVHRSRTRQDRANPRPADGVHYPDLLSAVTREEAERFAIDQSAADAEGRTYIVSNHETWKTAGEYRRGHLRLDRPHDYRPLKRPADPFAGIGAEHEPRLA